MRLRLSALALAVIGLAIVAVIAAEDTSKKSFGLPVAGQEVSLPEIKVICEQFGLDTLWLKIERDPPPRPFVSDGCTRWVDEINDVDIYPACFRHDLKYWAGYPGERVARLKADAEFMVEVAELLGDTPMAETMFAGVRLFGGDKLEATFSWGFGRQTD
jgi:hypothetical protein